MLARLTEAFRILYDKLNILERGSGDDDRRRLARELLTPRSHYRSTANLLEPLILLTYAAAVTERVELGTAVLMLPMRAPVLHAKMLASLDHRAGDRFILGAGVGWWKEEFEVLSMPFEQQGWGARLSNPD